MSLPQDKINRLKKTAAVASVCVACSLSLLKVIGALYTGSLAVLSSLIDSLADIFASLITFVAVRFSAQPADCHHRYGHGKAEALSALVQSAFVAGSGIFVMYDGFSRLVSPRPLSETNLGIIIMVIALVATLALIAFQKKVARLTQSTAIAADSAHYTVDVVTNLSIILTLVVVRWFGLDWFDTLTAFAVSGYLLVNAYKLAARAVAILMDKELGDDIRINIEKIITNYPFVRGLHDFRSRDLGGIYMFELHLELDGNLPLSQAHHYSNIIDDAIRQAYPSSQVIIHQDPAGLEEDRLDNRLNCPF